MFSREKRFKTSFPLKDPLYYVYFQFIAPGIPQDGAFVDCTVGPEWETQQLAVRLRMLRMAHTEGA